MSEENQNPTEPHVRRGLGRRTILAVLGAVALTICLIAGFILYKYQTKSKIVVPANLTVSQQSDYLAYKGDYVGAQDKVAGQIATAPNATAKTGLYLQQASIALNAKNYSDAKKYAQAAETLQPSDTTASLLGYIAAQTGDKVTAKQYYLKAIDRLDKNADSYNTSLQDNQTHIQELAK